MFAKIFEQIFDSSIAEDWQVRHVFEDLLKLCDRNGLIDRTPESIARRTNMPLDIVTRALAALEQPDPYSRSSEHEGRRIVRLHENRNWGWRIVNYERYRQVTSEEQRRTKNLEAVHRYREQRRAGAPVSDPARSKGSHQDDEGGHSRAAIVSARASGHVGHGSDRERTNETDAPALRRTPQFSLRENCHLNSPPTPLLSSTVISRHVPSRLSCHAEAEAEADIKLGRPLSVRERPIGEKPPPSVPETAKPTKPTKLSIPEKDLADRIEAALGDQWVNDAGKWIGRVRTQFRKTERVIAELENARKESRIASTPAQYAEDTWKRFAG